MQFFCFFIAIVCCLSLEVEDAILKQKFSKFLEKFEKSYSTEEEYAYRYRIFKNNLKEAQKLNSENYPKTLYGITKFMDYSKTEFKEKVLMKSVKESRNRKILVPNITTNNPSPKTFNWKDHGAEVKNQLTCGSCYSFSAVGAIEGQWYLAKKELINLSEQQIVDCDPYSFGCGGGMPVWSFDYLNYSAKGIESDKEYPYTGKDGYCKHKKKQSVATISDYGYLTKDEKKLKEILFQKGPLSIVLNANQLQYYHSGIYDPKDCDPTVLNHAVLSTGFGEEAVNGTTILFWYVKNSWGTDFGEDGYFRLRRDKNACGCAEKVSTVTCP